MAETTTDPKRQRVYLKSGMGSVAAEDYDEKVHGKALELSDDEYEARLRGVIPGTTPPAPAMAPPKVATTIAGLQTYDPATQPAPTPVVAPPAAVAVAPIGQPVATLTADEATAKHHADAATRAQADADKATAESDRAAKAKQDADDAAASAKQKAEEAAKPAADKGKR